MKNYDQSIETNHNPNWPYIPDHPYRVLIIGGLGSGKTNVLLNLRKRQQPDINKSYSYVKGPFESKYHLLISGRENVEIKTIQYPKAFIEYSQKIDDVYENLEGYNATTKMRVLIVFDNMIADMEYNKRLSPIVTELFLRGRKLNVSIVFTLQFYYKVPKL